MVDGAEIASEIEALIEVEVVLVVEVLAQPKCFQQRVMSAELNARFHSGLPVNDQCIAVTVLKKEARETDERVGTIIIVITDGITGDRALVKIRCSLLSVTNVEMSAKFRSDLPVTDLCTVASALVKQKAVGMGDGHRAILVGVGQI